MSRHSKWSKIKHQKAGADAKRGAVFTKLTRMITVAARERGPDPTTNSKLRLAMEAAREANMPKENIERAISRAVARESGSELFEVTYEAFGPGGVSLIIEAVTDNKNRTLNNLKLILGKHGGTLAGPGAVSWQFERRGEWIPKNTIRVADDQTRVELDTLLAALEEDEDVVDYVTNEAKDQISEIKN